jgi:Isochorismatase family
MAHAGRHREVTFHYVWLRISCSRPFRVSKNSANRRLMKRIHSLDIPDTLEEICDPARLALVVYDMQIGILKQLKNADEIVARVSSVLAAAREAGVRIFFMRHLSLPRELMGVFQYRMAMAWQRVDDPAEVAPWFLRDSPGSRPNWIRVRARRSSTSSRCRRSKARPCRLHCVTAALRQLRLSALPWK